MLGRNPPAVFAAINLGDMKDVLITLGIFAGLLFGMAIVVLLMKRWYGKSKEGLDSDELLSDFYDMVDAGELSPEEYKKIRASLNKIAQPIPAALPKPSSKALPKPAGPKPTVSDEPV